MAHSIVSQLDKYATDLTVARKCRMIKSYIFHSVSLRESLVALHIGVIGGWSPASLPELQLGSTILIDNYKLSSIPF